MVSNDKPTDPKGNGKDVDENLSAKNAQDSKNTLEKATEKKATSEQPAKAQDNSDQNKKKITVARVMGAAGHFATAAVIGQGMRYGLSVAGAATGTSTIAAVGAGLTSATMTAIKFKRENKKLLSKEFAKAAAAKSLVSATAAYGLSEVVSLAEICIPENAWDKFVSGVTDAFNAIFGIETACDIPSPQDLLDQDAELKTQAADLAAEEAENAAKEAALAEREKDLELREINSDMRGDELDAKEKALASTAFEKSLDTAEPAAGESVTDTTAPDEQNANDASIDEASAADIDTMKVDLVSEIDALLESGDISAENAQTLIDSINGGNAQEIKDNAFRAFNGFDCFEKNTTLGLHVYELAAEMGNKQAVSDLSYIEHYGLAGVEQDADAALGTMKGELNLDKQQSFDRWEITEGEAYTQKDGCGGPDTGAAAAFTDATNGETTPPADNDNTPPAADTTAPIADATTPANDDVPQGDNAPAAEPIPLNQGCPNLSDIRNQIWSAFEKPAGREGWCVQDYADYIDGIQVAQPQ